jgi:hypothetical protein
VKELYSTPRLSVHGDVEAITQNGGTGNADVTIVGGTVTGTTNSNGTGNVNITPAT